MLAGITSYIQVWSTGQPCTRSNSFLTGYVEYCMDIPLVFLCTVVDCHIVQHSSAISKQRFKWLTTTVESKTANSRTTFFFFQVCKGMAKNGRQVLTTKQKKHALISWKTKQLLIKASPVQYELTLFVYTCSQDTEPVAGATHFHNQRLDNAV